jgi:hypothetical protein
VGSVWLRPAPTRDAREVPRRASLLKAPTRTIKEEGNSALGGNCCSLGPRLLLLLRLPVPLSAMGDRSWTPSRLLRRVNE